MVSDMKIVYMWGTNYINILRAHSADITSVHVLMPDNEPHFPAAAQEAIREVLGERAIQVSYDQDEIANTLLQLNADVVISMGWRRIFGATLLSQLQDRLLINIHPAILPQYKGYHTEPYVIINAEKEHGITAHRLTQGLDDGDILHQLKFSISKFSTTASIKAQAHDRMPEFIGELLPLIVTGRVQEIPQDASLTKVVAPKRSPADSEVDPNVSLSDLYNIVRACDYENYPAFFYVDGQKIFISMRRADDSPREHDLEL